MVLESNIIGTNYNKNGMKIITIAATKSLDSKLVNFGGSLWLGEGRGKYMRKSWCFSRWCEDSLSFQYNYNCSEVFVGVRVRRYWER